MEPLSDTDELEKTFTIPLKLLDCNEFTPQTLLFDRLSELILEFFEDGKYSYYDYRSSNKQVPQGHRQAKSRVKKFLSKNFSDEGNFSQRIFCSMFQYMVEMDESYALKLKLKNRQLIKKDKELTSQVELLTKERDELQNTMDEKVRHMLENEVQNLLEDTMQEERELHKKKMKERYNIICKNDNTIASLKLMVEQGSETLIGEKADLVEQNHNLREENKLLKKQLEQRKAGRPSLSKKEKKRKEREKLKKQIAALADSSSDETDSDSD
jgi:hypothetical protein